MAKSEDQITVQPDTQPTVARPMWSPDSLTVLSGTPASRRTASQPGPAGCTFLKKEISVFRSVWGPKKAVSSQHTLVKATEMITVWAKGSPAPCFFMTKKVTEMMKELIIATTSHQAL